MNIERLETSFEKVVDYLEKKGAKKLFHGMHRAAMVRGQFVYKIPTADCGIEANFQEEYIFRKMAKKKELVVPLGYFDTKNKRESKLIGFARCRIVYICKIPVLLMERLTPFHKLDSRKTDFMDSFDGGQFGIGRKGDYLCYDYSRILTYNFKEPDEIHQKVLKYMKNFKDGECGWYPVRNLFDSCFGPPDIDKARKIERA